MNRARCPRSQLVAWVALLGALLAILTAGGPSAPPASAERWGQWLEATPPVEAGFALLRLSALGVGWYLAAATSVGLVLRLAGAPRLAAAADRLTVPAVRRVLAGVGLATVGLTTGAAAQVPPPSAPATTAAESTLTMRRLPPAEQAPAPVPSEPVQKGPSPWTVRSGECFWSIADQVLQEAWGRAATEQEIVPYWNRLIAANRASLVDPANPDLVYPGQTFTVPAP